MVQRNTKKRNIVLCVSAVLLIVAGLLIWNLSRPYTEAGTKSVSIEVLSERDSYKEDFIKETDKETLGEFLEETGMIEYSDSEYGRYIISVQGMSEDKDNQYWWYVEVNGKGTEVGIDEVPVKDGDQYKLELKQGW